MKNNFLINFSVDRENKKIKVEREFTAPISNKFYEALNSTVVSVEINFDGLADLEKIIKMGFKEGFISALENLDKLI